MAAPGDAARHRPISARQLRPEQVKSCCADLYSSDWARLLIGESFHPGGTRLTDRLAELLDLRPGSRVLDLAAGPGTSAIHLAGRVGCQVVGIDLSARNVEEAAGRARKAGVEHLTTFRQGDAERVGLPDGGFDAIICECAFCTFPDKPGAAREIRRLLRPGGRVGISDLTRDGPIHPELGGLLAWVTCVADAAPLEEYARHLCGAGLAVEVGESHDECLLETVESIRGKLLAANLVIVLRQLRLAGADLDGARAMARTALGEIRAGHLGYAILTARRPLAR